MKTPAIHDLLRCASVLLAAGALLLPARAGDPQHVARIRQAVAFDQKLGAQVDGQLVFLDEEGREVRLADFQHGKPLIVTPVYYGCPMLCTQVLNGFVDGLKHLTLEPGRDFEIVTFSIDPRDTPQLARQKKAAYLERLGKPGAAAGWHFLCAAPRNALAATSEGEARNSAIDALTSTIGFHYAYDAEIKQYAHAGGVVVLTPEGRAAKYLYGIEFSPRDLRLSLVESSAGKIGSVTDQLFLWLCYHYDPLTGKYSFAVMSIVRALGALTVLVLMAFLVRNLVRERRALRLQAGG